MDEFLSSIVVVYFLETGKLEQGSVETSDERRFRERLGGRGLSTLFPFGEGGNEFGIKIWENKFLCGFLVIPNKEDVSSAITSISASEADEFSSPRGKGRGIRAEYRVKKINVGGNRC